MLLATALTLFATVATVWFLPRWVVALRFYLFTKINGDEGVQLPNDVVPADQVKALYGHPAASLRSKQNNVGLSDFFWYLLAPAHYIHQEHVETATHTYPLVTNATKRLLNQLDTSDLVKLATKHAELALSKQSEDSWTTVRCRDFYFPQFARMFYELVFLEPCSDETATLICASADNIISALKCTTIRDMPLRKRLTDYLESRIVGGACERAFLENSTHSLSNHEKALHLQGVFFHTGCVQMSEAMSHLVLAVAQNRDVQRRLWLEVAKSAAESTETPVVGDCFSGHDYLDLVIAETLRLYPLFGIAHRIAADDITMSDGHVFAKGTVLCFNYPLYHSTGYDRPFEFNPERLRNVARREANFFPFGIAKNRPCPAERVGMIWMKEMLKVLVRRRALLSPADHTRSLPCRGVCILIPRTSTNGRDDGSTTMLPITQLVVLKSLWIKEKVDALIRSIVQLVLCTYMIWDARRLQLAFKFYSTSPDPDVARKIYKEQNRE